MSRRSRSSGGIRRCAGVAIAAVALWSAGGATGAQAATVSCGEVITTSITVDNDLSNCSQGLIVGANEVELDLDGHRIDGTGGGIGVNLFDGVRRVTLRNGVVQQFGIGVFVDDGPANDLLDLTLRANTVDGVQADGGADRLEIRGVRALGNGGDGFSLGALASPVLVGNRAEGNDDSGFTLFNVPDARLVRNRAIDSGVFGFRGNAGTTATHVIGGLARGSGFEGYEFDGARTRLERVRAVRNGGDGIRPSGDRSRLLESSAIANEGEGIVVCPGCDDVQLRHNSAERNQQNGILALNATTRLRANRADDNGVFGIDAVAGVIDLGQNLASGNGAAPPECRNVVCS